MTTTLFKNALVDSKAAAAQRKAQRTIARRRAAAAVNRAAQRAWSKRRKEVWLRDNGCSRISGVAVSLAEAEIHHLTYRSLGGSHDLSNLITVTPQEHEDIHAKRLRVSGTADALLISRPGGPVYGEERL